jgi:MurNAc alpha-1-phosphate uridylyltransferase
LSSLTLSPDHAIVLAAGLGKRMRPLTNNTPKPLLKVSNKALLDHGLDALAAAGVVKSVVNVHYLAEQIETHVAGRQSPKILVSDERDLLLDSGGGIKNALGELGNAPFYLLNADSFWIEGQGLNLVKMSDDWVNDNIDILLLVAPLDKAVGFGGKGDFFMDQKGRLARRGDKNSAPYVYAGAAILSPKIFENSPDGPFSLNKLFDEAIAKGRLFGTQMDGLWLHVGTPSSITEAEHAISNYLS